MRAFGQLRSITMTKETWGRYVRAISSNQTEIAERVGSSSSTVSRWMSGEVVPSAQLVIALARAYRLSPVAALVAAGYLEESELADTGSRPRSLSLMEFTDLELAHETLRRVEAGFSHILEQPLDPSHPAMQRRGAHDVVPGEQTSGIEELDVPILTAEELEQRDLDLAALRDQEESDGHNARPRS